MVSLERIDINNQEQIDRYLYLLELSYIPEVMEHLPEIFEEDTTEKVQQGIRSMQALRYLVVVEGVDVGRTELTRNLNHDPSIVSRNPEGVTLGYNTCYFVNPRLVNRELETVHKLVADVSIKEAFNYGDKNRGYSPWLPVSMDGTDVSRGWLMQDGNPMYSVHGDEPQAGIFPQFGIGDNEYSLQYAVLNK